MTFAASSSNPLLNNRHRSSSSVSPRSWMPLIYKNVGNARPLPRVWAVVQAKWGRGSYELLGYTQDEKKILPFAVGSEGTTTTIPSHLPCRPSGADIHRFDSPDVRPKVLSFLASHLAWGPDVPCADTVVEREVLRSHPLSCHRCSCECFYKLVTFMLLESDWTKNRNQCVSIGHLSVSTGSGRGAVGLLADRNITSVLN